MLRQANLQLYTLHKDGSLTRHKSPVMVSRPMIVSPHTSKFHTPEITESSPHITMQPDPQSPGLPSHISRNTFYEHRDVKDPRLHISNIKKLVRLKNKVGATDPFLDRLFALPPQFGILEYRDGQKVKRTFVVGGMHVLSEASHDAYNSWDLYHDKIELLTGLLDEHGCKAPWASFMAMEGDEGHILPVLAGHGVDLIEFGKPKRPRRV